jgi:hypothetical protein
MSGLKLNSETVDLMLRCWAEWTMTGRGGTPWDDTPRDPIYIGAEPVPDTPMLIEQAFAEVRQSDIGKSYLRFVELHYCHYNRPTYVKLNLMKSMLNRRISKDEFYDSAKIGKTLVHYELQQIDGRGQRSHKALKKRKVD